MKAQARIKRGAASIDVFYLPAVESCSLLSFWGLTVY